MTERKKYTRDELIVGYFGLVDVIVDKLLIHRFYRDCKPIRDELVSEGYLGLIHAIDTYKDDRGAKLVTYISLKVRGYVIDYIRKYRKQIRTVSLEVEEIGEDDLLIEEKDYDEDEAYRLYDKYEPKDKLSKEIYNRCINGATPCSTIAKEFKMSLNSIKLRKRRLISKLRKQIQKGEGLYVDSGGTKEITTL